MKKLLLVSAALAGFMLLNGQAIVTYQAHALKVDVDNPMSYCDYLNAGPSGENMRWDFSSLKFQKSFTGYLNNPKLTENGRFFSDANIELAEFSSRFYFRTNEKHIEQFGYSSADGKSQILYDSPFIKMKYPFAFGDIYSGSFGGQYIYAGLESGKISGSYTVEADAYGTLVLPGNAIYENTLRVRTEKSYTTQFTNSSQEVSIVTYRWYNQSHRYPLLVLTEYTTKSGTSEHTNYQAAYNNNAVNDIVPVMDDQLALYPNPVSSKLMLDLNSSSSGELNFKLIDASGRLVREFIREADAVGRQQFDLSDELSGLYPGSYTLVIESETGSIQRSFSKIK